MDTDEGAVSRLIGALAGDEPLVVGRLLTANNKWLIASEGTDEAADGAFIGIHGPAVDLFP